MHVRFVRGSDQGRGVWVKGAHSPLAPTHTLRKPFATHSTQEEPQRGSRPSGQRGVQGERGGRAGFPCTKAQQPTYRLPGHRLEWCRQPQPSPGQWFRAGRQRAESQAVGPPAQCHAAAYLDRPPLGQSPHTIVIGQLSGDQGSEDRHNIQDSNDNPWVGRNGCSGEKYTTCAQCVDPGDWNTT